MFGNLSAGKRKSRGPRVECVVETGVWGGVNMGLLCAASKYRRPSFGSTWDTRKMY